MGATAPHIIGDQSYFPNEKLVKGKQVVRSICFLNHTIEQTKGNESCQIIIPALQVKEAGFPARTKDIYISMVSFAHHVAPKGKYIAIVSTEVETTEPLKELEAGIQLLGKIEDRFTLLKMVCRRSPVVQLITATSHLRTTVHRIFKVWRPMWSGSTRQLPVGISTCQSTPH